MKNQAYLKLGALTTGTLLFNWLFWDQYSGLNLVIFSIFLLLTCWLFDRQSFKYKGVQALAFGVLITDLAILYHNSSMATFTLVVSLYLFVGFYHQPQLRSILYTIPTSITNYLLLPKSFSQSISSLGTISSPIKKGLRFMKLTLLPLGILLIFFFIFQEANPVFEELTIDLSTAVGEFLEEIFENIAFTRFLFILWGATVVGAFFYNSYFASFVNEELLKVNYIQRKRKARKVNYSPFSMSVLGLKNEYRSAFILIVLVNFLLLIVNVIDIQWIWFGFEYDGSFNLSQFVHEGTYLLILSILLSMAILLYFFRGNQNFAPYKDKLKILATIWIAQNIILVISVGIRNYHYIAQHGLAYKRIGVIFFLLLTLFGIYTMYQKITHQKSLFYLLKTNGWSVYVAFLIMSLINWDFVIFNHNVNHPLKKNIDVPFLLSLSDKTLPLVDQHRELLDYPNTYTEREYQNYHLLYQQRIDSLKADYKDFSWQSWSYLDHKAYTHFNTSTQ